MGSAKGTEVSHHQLPLRLCWQGDFTASLSASAASVSPARLVTSATKKYLTAKKVTTLNRFLAEMPFGVRFLCLKLSPSPWSHRGRIS